MAASPDDVSQQTAAQTPSGSGGSGDLGSLLSSYQGNLNKMQDIGLEQAQSIKNEEGAFSSPPPQPPGHGMMSSMPFLLALTAIGGATTGLHGRVMLGALSGMAKGVVDGNEQAFQDSMKTYEENRKKLADYANLQNQYYQALYDAYGRTAEGQLQAITMAREITGDQLKENLALQHLNIDATNSFLTGQRLSMQIANMKNQDSYRKAMLHIQELKLQQAAQDANLDTRGKQILGELRTLFPQAASGFGFGTKNMIMTIQSVEVAPDNANLTPKEIAVRIGQNYLSGKAALAGATKVGQREGGTLPAINALISDGGILDQAIAVAKKLGFGNNKVENAAILKSQEYIGNPLVAQYKQYMNAVNAEWSQVLARGGMTTDMVREEVQGAVGGNASMQELEGFKTSMPREANSILKGSTTATQQLYQESQGQNPELGGASGGSSAPQQYTSLSQLQDAYKEKKISRADAIKIAKEKGWIQ